MAIRMLLVDDHQLIRKGLKALLEQQPGMLVIAEAENGRKAVDLALKEKPDVVVMDIGMPDLNGIEATRQIKASLPATRIIGLSMHSDRRFIVGMLQAGASGYLLKDCAFEELAQAVGVAAGGQVYLSPSIAGTVIENLVNKSVGTSEAPSPDLTPREREALQLLAEGHTTKEIAGKLHVSVKTIDTYRQNIMKKLDLHSVAELTKYAIRTGLTTVEA